MEQKNLDNIEPENRINFVNTAIDNDGIPKYYANGFTFAAGNADFILVLQKNNRPELVVNLSLTIAKTLAEKLGDFIKNLEENSGSKILTTNQIESALKKI